MESHPTATVFLFARFPGGWRIGLIRHPRHRRWMPPGGHVEPGESPAEAAEREVIEETGLAPRGLRLHAIVSYEVSGPRHIHIDHWYEAVVHSRTPAGPAELAVGWFGPGELPGGMFPNSRHCAESLLDRRVIGAEGDRDDLGDVGADHDG